MILNPHEQTPANAEAAVCNFQTAAPCVYDAFPLGTVSGLAVPGDLSPGVAESTERPPPYFSYTTDPPPYSQPRHDITTLRLASGDTNNIIHKNLAIFNFSQQYI